MSITDVFLWVGYIAEALSVKWLDPLAPKSQWLASDGLIDIAESLA